METKITVQNTRNQAETILIIVISVLIFLVLCATVVMIILVIRMTRKYRPADIMAEDNEIEGDEEK